MSTITQTGYTSNISKHKSNLRYPQFIRVHPVMPYFCFIPTVEEAYAIGPNDKMKTKLRLVVFDSKVDNSIMNKEFEDFNKIN